MYGGNYNEGYGGAFSDGYGTQSSTQSTLRARQDDRFSKVTNVISKNQMRKFQLLLGGKCQRRHG